MYFTADKEPAAAKQLRVEVSSMRIGFVGMRGVPAKYGGSETAIEEIGSRLASRGHEVYVFCRRHKSESDDPIYRGMHRIILPSINHQAFDTLSHSLLALLTCEARSCDVLHFIGMGTALLLPLAKLAKCGTVTTIDGFDWRRAKWGRLARVALKIGLRLTFRASDEILVDAETALEEFAQMFGRRATYVPYGVSVDPTSRSDIVTSLGIQPFRYFLFVGRIIPDKGIHILIEAFKRTAGEYNLAIVGADDGFGEYMHRIQQMANTDKRILLLPPQYGESYHQLCSNSLAYVQPSLMEGTSPQLLSALAFARPVIASGIPTIKETVGDTAMLFRPGDVSSLCDCIRQLLADLHHYEKQAVEARDRVLRRYSWDRVTDFVEHASTKAMHRS